MSRDVRRDGASGNDLAAGKGERMLPLTAELPKPLLPIGDTTLIQRHLRRLADAGIERVVINVHYLGEIIVDHFGSGTLRHGTAVFSGTRIVGNGGRYSSSAADTGDEPFLIVNGDIYTDFPFSHLVQQVLSLALTASRDGG